MGFPDTGFSISDANRKRERERERESSVEECAAQETASINLLI